MWRTDEGTKTQNMSSSLLKISSTVASSRRLSLANLMGPSLQSLVNASMEENISFTTLSVSGKEEEALYLQERCSDHRPRRTLTEDQMVLFYRLLLCQNTASLLSWLCWNYKPNWTEGSVTKGVFSIQRFVKYNWSSLSTWQWYWEAISQVIQKADICRYIITYTLGFDIVVNELFLRETARDCKRYFLLSHHRCQRLDLVAIGGTHEHNRQVVLRHKRSIDLLGEPQLPFLIDDRCGIEDDVFLLVHEILVVVDGRSRRERRSESLAVLLLLDDHVLWSLLQISISSLLEASWAASLYGGDDR